MKPSRLTEKHSKHNGSQSLRTTITCYDTGQYDYHVPFCVESGIFRVRRQRRKRGSLGLESEEPDESSEIEESRDLEEASDIEGSRDTDS